MTAPVIELYPGAEDSPFAGMMVELIRQNVADHPSKLADFARMRGRVALIAEDIDAAVTLRFDDGKMSVHRGLYGIPDIAIRGTSESLVDLSRIPPHARLPGLPDPRSTPARAVAKALRERTLRVYGLLGHPGLGLRLSRVMSVY